MLSAQKQKMPSQIPPGGSHSPTTTGFGKVLHSIQGLQQRLDDFSIEEVSRSHTRAHELIRELGGLQTRLEAVAKIRDATAGIEPQIAAMPEANFDLVPPDSLEKYPQLQAVIQTANLIRTSRSLQTKPANTQPARTDDESPVFGSPSSSAMEPTSAAAPGSRPPRTYEFSELRLEEPPQAPPEDASRESAMARGKHTPTPKSKKPKGKPHFDQRLLDEVIETYGEFAMSARPAGAAEKAETAPAAPEQTIPPKTGPISAQPPALEVSLAPAKDILANELVPVEPAFVQAGAHELLALPGPAEQSAGPSFDEAPTTAKARGEIDRQLKSIIKDYGEVDLYSHRKSPNIKAVTMAVAAVLALLLGAFFVFNSPSTPAPASIDAAAPAGETQNPSAKKILKQEK
jgi:hypothetical protein